MKRGWLHNPKEQKIAAFGSSYIGMHIPVGAAEGCDLLLLTIASGALISCQ
jgi:hypothetical protein